MEPNECEFVGGPLDGTNPIDPAQNTWFRVPGYPDWVYVWYNGKYYWQPSDAEGSFTH